MILLENVPPCYYSFHTYAPSNPYEVQDRLIEDLIKDIEDALGLKVSPPDGLNINIVSPNEFTYTSSSGEYDPITKTIVLYNGLWCRTTLIHELLHAISYFSRVPELYHVAMCESYLIEGLTEFLTGYVLYSKYPDCHTQWISKRHPVCSVTYEMYVRLFGAIAQILIPISDLVKLYVYDPNKNWFEEYEKFLERYGLEDFLVNKPKITGKPSVELIRDIIVKVLRERLGEEKVKEFEELLYEAPLDVVLDYSNMMK